MSVMLTKFKSKSNRVKGMRLRAAPSSAKLGNLPSFLVSYRDTEQLTSTSRSSDAAKLVTHTISAFTADFERLICGPINTSEIGHRRPVFDASGHRASSFVTSDSATENLAVVLVDGFEEQEGPVRGVNFHLSRALLVTGGDDYKDDYKIKVWDIRPQNRQCLFTLHGHLDYVRTVQFHHEMPWIISTSDDQTILIWNSTSRNCIAILTGHSHYVMSALFHPKDDLVVSASMDQTVRVWDISGLHKGSPNSGGGSGPDNFETFDTFSTVKYVLEGNDRSVNYAMFHPTLPLIISAADDRTIKIWRMSETKAWEHELIVSCGEDKTVRVWDLAKRTAIQTFRRENDRFWVLASHPNLNLFAAGHDSGLIEFKLERERPSFAVHQDSLYYIRDKYVRSYDFNAGADLGLLSRAVLVTISSDNGLYKLASLPQQAQGEVKDSSVDGKKGAGQSGIFVARNRFAVLQKATQIIEVRDLANSVVKTIKPPVQTNEIFYGGTASLILSSTSSVVLYDIQQQKTLAEVNSPPVKYVVWSNDGSLLALMSKHTITIADKNFSQHSLIHETIRIKFGAWGPASETGQFAQFLSRPVTKTPSDFISVSKQVYPVWAALQYSSMSVILIKFASRATHFILLGLCLPLLFIIAGPQESELSLYGIESPWLSRHPFSHTCLLCPPSTARRILLLIVSKAIPAVIITTSARNMCSSTTTSSHTPRPSVNCAAWTHAVRIRCPTPAHPTLLHPCTLSSSPFASTCLTAAYAVLPLSSPAHRRAPSCHPSTITSTSEYFRAPTSGYAHAGAPKRFVYLVGLPLDLALDARGGRVLGAEMGVFTSLLHLHSVHLYHIRLLVLLHPRFHTAYPHPHPPQQPGTLPPSPEAPPPEARACWGPLIGIAQGVQAVKRVRGSGGWAGGVYQGYAGEMEGYGYVYAGGPGADSVDTNISRMYEVVEHADGWDVVHEGHGVHGWVMEGMGMGMSMGMSMSWAIASVSTTPPRGKSRRCDCERERDKRNSATMAQDHALSQPFCMPENHHFRPHGVPLQARPAQKQLLRDAYLQQKGFLKIVLHVIQDTNTWFELAMETWQATAIPEMLRTNPEVMTNVLSPSNNPCETVPIWLFDTIIWYLNDSISRLFLEPNRPSPGYLINPSISDDRRRGLTLDVLRAFVEPNSGTVSGAATADPHKVCVTLAQNLKEKQTDLLRQYEDLSSGYEELYKDYEALGAEYETLLGEQELLQERLRTALYTNLRPSATPVNARPGEFGLEKSPYTVTSP
ncbi:hypothetical protein B0H13DRAFT_2410437 [Mycena leptocephala]|nr:hypothetical protein B0H13DRAFT_2410437 [Mycena leptocephala]